MLERREGDECCVEIVRKDLEARRAFVAIEGFQVWGGRSRGL